MTTRFRPSDFTVGMEMEFQLVDTHSLDLVDGIMPLMELYPGSHNIKPEMIQNTVEVASEPCRTTAELEQHMNSLVTGLRSRCEALGMRLCGAGTHPFCTRPAAVTPQPRYLSMKSEAGLLIHRQVTFATHVHLGMPSGDEALQLMRELKPYLPVLVALSANSPYWHGDDTGFAAWRLRVLAASRNYDFPPDFADWRAFERFLATMRHAAVIDDMRDVHWHIRPRPHLGTLEVRIMDVQPTVTMAISLAVFIQALVLFLRAARNGNSTEKPLQPLSWWSLKDNCYIASRYGIDAKFIVNEKGDIESLRDIALGTLDRIAPYTDAASGHSHLERLRRMIDEGPPYQRQRRIFQATGSLEEVVHSLSRELAEEAAVVQDAVSGA